MTNEVVIDGIVVKIWKYADDMLFRLTCYRNPDLIQKPPGGKTTWYKRGWRGRKGPRPRRSRRRSRRCPLRRRAYPARRCYDGWRRKKGSISMSSKSELLKLLKILTNSYPDYELGEETHDIYLAVLQDIPFEVLKTAALDHISRSSWFPKACELRMAAVEMALDCRHTTSAYEVWGEAEYAMRRWGRDRKWDFDNPVLEQTIAALGWHNLCTSTNQAAEAVTLPQVREMAAKLCGRLAGTERRELPEPSEVVEAYGIREE